MSLFSWISFSLLIIFATLVIGSYYWNFLKKNIDDLAFIAAMGFNFYLAYSLYISQLDFFIMRFSWVFVGISGICFSKKWQIIALLAASYLLTSVVHFMMPPEVSLYPVWSYLLFTPPVAILYYTIVSQGMVRHEKLMEKERMLLLKTSELDTILNTLNAMVAFKDSNNVLKKVNRAMAEFMGMTKEKLEGASMYDMFEYQLAKEFHDEDMKVIATGKPFLNRLEKVYYPGSEELMWLRTSKYPFVDENGKIEGVVFSSEDVTDQVKAEIKIRENEERFRMIFENAPDGMALIEHPSWRFIRTNRAMVDILGYDNGELMKKSPFDLVHPDDALICRQLYDDINNGTILQHTSEKRYLHKDGKIVHGSLSVCVVNENDNPKYLIISLKDITQQKESDIKLKRYARQLEESNQNLQEFAYAASHDLREPLRTVVSYVQLLKRRLPQAQLDANSNEFMDFVIGGAKRMESQIQALLDYSRAGKGELNLTRFDLKDAVGKVCLGLQRQMAENQATVEIGEVPWIAADRLQIETLMQNLISNAIKYRDPERRPHIVVTTSVFEQYWQIAVADNGIGIEDEFLEKMFAVFRRLHHSQEIPGTGVGLAICRRITQRHDGKIWANSQPGKGSTFYFTVSKMLAENAHSSSPEVNVPNAVKEG